MNDANSPAPAPQPSARHRAEANRASTPPPAPEPRSSQLWWFAVTVAGAAMLFVLFNHEDARSVPGSPPPNPVSPSAVSPPASRGPETEASSSPAAPSVSAATPLPPPPIFANPPRSSGVGAARAQNPPVDPDAGPPAPVAPAPPATREQARQVVNGVQFTLRDYRLALGGNPVGTNAEITQSLLGDNRRQARFTVPDGSQVNGNGELCDPWGTPYFFHALARDHMEVRSAGPDRKMYTPDDIVQ